jgi:hypothetical protein
VSSLETLGWPTQNGTTSSLVAGELVALPITLTRAAVIDNFSVYSNSMSGAAQLALYAADAMGNPTGGVLSNTPSFGLSKGMTLTANPTIAGHVVQPGNYFIAVWVNTANTSLGLGGAGTVAGSQFTFTYQSGTWPSLDVNGSAYIGPYSNELAVSMEVSDVN